ncbi:MAG: hypothetical protein IJV22_07265 [Bacteroidales bacterium]|nr:hypothetical protein [Bacteroidales bacterium]
MIRNKTHKKNLIISYKNLTDELRELFKEQYPDGYSDYIQKTIKPNGEPIFVVPLDTEEVAYMVKFDVKIDTGMVEEYLEKDNYSDDNKENDDYAPLSEAIEKEEGSAQHKVGSLKHGAYDDVFPDETPVDNFEMSNEDLKKSLTDDGEEDEEDFDNYTDDGSADDAEEEEPSSEELMNIDDDVIADGLLSAEEMMNDIQEISAGKRPSRKKASVPQKNESTPTTSAETNSKSSSEKDTPAPKATKKVANKKAQVVQTEDISTQTMEPLTPKKTRSPKTTKATEELTAETPAPKKTRSSRTTKASEELTAEASDPKKTRSSRTAKATEELAAETPAPKKTRSSRTAKSAEVKSNNAPAPRKTTRTSKK